MTQCAPRALTISTFLVLHTPVTSAPKDLAICTAKVPTPPAAPLIKTLCPDRIRPLSRSPCNAVSAAIGAEAACSNVTFTGFATNTDFMTAPDSEEHTYSAKAPRQVPKTSSPGLNCVTFLPTDSTQPATSTPGRLIFGLPSPSSVRMMYGPPDITFQSSGLTEAARTLTKTSFSLGTGVWT